MTIAYFSNFMNHHQKCLSDELFRLSAGNFVFVETEPIYDWLKKGGYSDFSNLDYVICAWKNEENRKKAEQLALTVDVALFGGYTVLNYLILRARRSDKISFDVSERWLKRGWLNVLSPRLIKSQYYYHTLFHRKPVYKLCSSAYAAGDQYKMHSYVNRCYKWGYFTQVDNDYIINVPEQGTFKEEIIPLMWCSRFLQWKHPELPVLLAERLKNNGYKFCINMFGSGEKMGATKNLIVKHGVGNYVVLRGNLPNADMLKEMRNHKIFLFTSDKNEGWGAVLNESMANGCVPVVSNAIGSAPFLVKNEENGYLFDSPKPNSGIHLNKTVIDEHALDSLYAKVAHLLDEPDNRAIMAQNAYSTMINVWSPKNAATNFLKLVEDLSSGRDTSIQDGPCSKALPL